MTDRANKITEMIKELQEVRKIVRGKITAVNEVRTTLDEVDRRIGALEDQLSQFRGPGEVPGNDPSAQASGLTGGSAPAPEAPETGRGGLADAYATQSKIDKKK
jgi:hypothetical protein